MPAVDWLPVRVEVEDENGQRVDLHPLAFAEDGSAVQAGLGGTEFRYAADAFTTGKITGQPVDCLTAEQQLRFRRGTPGVALIFMMSRSYGRCFRTVKTANPDDEDLSRSLVEHVGRGRRGANRRA